MAFPQQKSHGGPFPILHGCSNSKHKRRPTRNLVKSRQATADRLSGGEAMSTFSHPLEPIRIKRLSVVRKDTPTIAEPSQEDMHLYGDDGLGCMRGLAVAMLCNVILASIVIVGWELWRLLR